MRCCLLVGVGCETEKRKIEIKNGRQKQETETNETNETGTTKQSKTRGTKNFQILDDHCVAQCAALKTK